MLRNRIVHGYWSIDINVLQDHRPLNFASRVSARAVVSNLLLAPEMQIQGIGFLVGSHAFCRRPRPCYSDVHLPTA